MSAVLSGFRTLLAALLLCGTVVVVNADGSSDLYACEEDSPPPCVWDCATMGNRICGQVGP